MSVKQVVFIAPLIIVLPFLYGINPIGLTILTLLYVILVISTFNPKKVLFANNAPALTQIFHTTLLPDGLIWEKIQEAPSARRLRSRELGLSLQRNNLFESLVPLVKGERRVAYGVVP